MVDLNKTDPLKLIQCDNEKCGKYSFELDLEESDCKCPYCAKPLSKNAPTKITTGETIVLSYVANSKEKLKKLIDFLISQNRKIAVHIDGNRTSYTSRIIKTVYGNNLLTLGKRDRLIIEKLIPDTGNAFFKFSRRVLIQFFLRNQVCQFESKYLGESTKNPHIGLIFSFPEFVELKYKTKL